MIMTIVRALIDEVFFSGWTLRSAHTHVFALGSKVGESRSCQCPLANFASSLSDVSLMDLFSSIPKYAIVVMEDIDCVFPPSMVNREDMNSAFDRNGLPMPTFNEQATMVTLSGLLNVLDGVGSEDGRILFATVRQSWRLTVHSTYLSY